MTTTQKLAEALRGFDRLITQREHMLGGLTDEMQAVADNARTALAEYEAGERGDGHTAGAWIVEPVTLTVSAPNPKGSHRPRVPVCYPQDTIHRAENMRRIVACVNACDGASTTDLESGNYGIVRTRHEYTKPLTTTKPES